MSKGTRWIKRAIALLLVLLLSIESFGAIVSDNDGSAFITKAEFDSLKNDFQVQIDNYNTSIDNKIDGAIAEYLAGIKMAKNEELTPIKYDNYFNGAIGISSNFKDLFTLPYPDINVINEVCCFTSRDGYLDNGVTLEDLRWYSNDGRGLCLTSLLAGKSLVGLCFISDKTVRTLSLLDTSNPVQYFGNTAATNSCDAYGDSTTNFTELKGDTNWTRNSDGMRSALFRLSSAWAFWGTIVRQLWWNKTPFESFTMKRNTITYERNASFLTRSFYTNAENLHSKYVLSGEKEYPAGRLIRFDKQNNNWSLRTCSFATGMMSTNGDGNYNGNVFRFPKTNTMKQEGKLYNHKARNTTYFQWPASVTVWGSSGHQYASWSIGAMDSWKPNTAGTGYIYDANGFNFNDIDADYNLAPVGIVPNEVKDHLQKANGCLPIVKLNNIGIVKWKVELKKLDSIGNNDGVPDLKTSDIDKNYDIYLSVVGPLDGENWTYSSAKAKNKILKMSRGTTELKLDDTKSGYKLKNGDDIRVEVNDKGIYGICFQLFDKDGKEVNSFIPWEDNKLMMEVKD